MKNVKKQMKDQLDEDQLKHLAVSGMTMISAIVVKRLIEYVWKKSTDRNPPKNPASRSVSWKEALLYTVVSGLLVSITKLLIRRNIALEIEDDL